MTHDTLLKGLTYAGSFAVDSGQAMVGDPCYLDGWDTNAEDEFIPEKHEGQYSYLGACNQTINEAYGAIGGSSAVVFSTGYGDGLYPVYVKTNDDGRVTMVVIDFDGELGDEE